MNQINAKLKILKTEMDTKINSLSKLNAENENKNEKLKAEKTKFAKEIGELQSKKESFEEKNNKLNDDIRSSKASLELKKLKLQNRRNYT